ncbi:MAG: hypothetical protein ACKN9U_04390 [Pirellulaceae bacterium]
MEAFESELEDWMCIGVQFHPESPAASALDVRIFEEFVEGVVRCQAQPLRLVG